MVSLRYQGLPVPSAPLVTLVSKVVAAVVVPKAPRVSKVPLGGRVRRVIEVTPVSVGFRAHKAFKDLPDSTADLVLKALAVFLEPKELEDRKVPWVLPVSKDPRVLRECKDRRVCLDLRDRRVTLGSSRMKTWSTPWRKI